MAPPGFDILHEDTDCLVIAKPAGLLTQAPLGIDSLEFRIRRFLKERGDNLGEIYLGIDPFFYFEDLHKLPGMPALQYDWRIERILLETTPWLSTKRPEGGTLMERDKTKESFREVERTDAWQDDEGRGSYELECEKIG